MAEDCKDVDAVLKIPQNPLKMTSGSHAFKLSWISVGTIVLNIEQKQADGVTFCVWHRKDTHWHSKLNGGDGIKSF